MNAPLPTPVQERLTAYFRESPFAVPGEYHEVQVPAGLSIQEIVDRLAKPWQQDYLRVILNDDIVAKEAWPLTVPNQKDVINLVMVPGSNDAGSILKAVAVIIVAVVVTYLTGGTATPLLSPALAAGAGAVAGLATSLALNSLFPPPTATASALSASGASTDTAYGFSSTSNSLKPYSIVPRLYGRRTFMPDYAIKPYIVSSGSTQYLYQAFCLGYGPLLVEDIKIGDTSIDNYADIEYVVHEAFQAGDTLQYISQDVWQDPYSIKLLQNAETIVESTDTAEKLVVDLQFNSGLFWVSSSSGTYNAQSVQVALKVRKYGTTEWTDINALDCTVEGATISGDSLLVSGYFQKPFFVTVTITLPEAGKYEILPIRLTVDREELTTDKSYDTVYLASVQSIRNVAPLAPRSAVTIIEMRAKATEQFNGAISDLTVTATSKLPVYRDGEWVVEATRNPAWCSISAMQGAECKKPIADKRIIFADYIEWAEWCDSAMPSDSSQVRATCDLLVTSKTTQWDIMKTLAATGYASPTRSGLNYTICIDRPVTTPVQFFSPKNSRGLEGTITYHEQPHALRVQYTPIDSTDSEEVVVYDDGYSADGSNGTTKATIYETLELVGIGRYEQAWVMGRRSLAQGRLRIEEWEISVDIEHMLCRRGSYVRLAHDLPLIGSGTRRITNVFGQSVTVDAPLEMSGQIYCLVRTSLNEQKEFTVVSYTDTAVVLEGDLSAIDEGDLITFGNIERVYQDCFVKSIKSATKMAARLVLIPYAPGIYTADTQAIPAYEANLPAQTGGTSAGGSTGVTSSSTTPGQVQSLQDGVFVTYSGGAPKISVSLSWRAPVSGRASSYQVFHYWNGAWRSRGTFYDTTALAYSEYTFLDDSGQPVNMNGVAMKFAVVAINGDGASLTPDLSAQITVIPHTDDPATVSALTTSGGAFCINVLWALQTNGFDAAHVEIWGSTSNDRSQATLMATPAVSVTHWQLNGLSVSAKYYFWIRVIDGNGDQSDWYPESGTAGVPGQPITDPAYLLAALDGAIGLDQLAADLAKPLGDVESMQFQLDWETANNSILRTALEAFSSARAVQATAQVQTEKTERVTETTALAEQITVVESAAENAVAAVREDLQAATGEDSALAQFVMALQARLDTGDYAAVKQTIVATANALNGIKAQYIVQVDANGNMAAINLETGEESSSMIFLADKFLFAKPDGTSPRTFMELGTIDGVEVLGIKATLLGADGIYTGKLIGNQIVGATGTFYGQLLAGTVDLSTMLGYTEIRTLAGTYTFTIADGYTSIKYELLAGGGGGAVGQYGEWDWAAGGGGAGGAGQTISGVINNLPVGATITLVIGAGGIGGKHFRQAGTAGGITAIYVNGSLVVSADSGKGGSVGGGPGINGGDFAWGGNGGAGYPAGGVGGYSTNDSDGNFYYPIGNRGGNGGSSKYGLGGSGVQGGPGNSATGWGSGGAGGGFAWGWRGSGHSAAEYNGWYAAGDGTQGRATLEFFNPNGVVLRSEFNALVTRINNAGIA